MTWAKYDWDKYDLGVLYGNKKIVDGVHTSSISFVNTYIGGGGYGGGHSGGGYGANCGGYGGCGSGGHGGYGAPVYVYRPTQAPSDSGKLKARLYLKWHAP